MTNTEMVFIKELTPRNKLSPQLNENIISDLLEQGFFDSDNFSFVGIYYCHHYNKIIVGIPKYRNLPTTSEENCALLEEIGLICRIAEQANFPSDPRQDDRFQSSQLRGALHHSNPYELAVFILQDYAENGLYQERTTKKRNDGVGSRSWGKTLRHTIPVFDREPLYLRPISIQHKRANSSIITPLHAHVVKLCAKLLQPLQLFENVQLPEDVQPLPTNIDCSQYIPVINEKLTQTFSDRELRLLRGLRAWCGQTPHNQTRFGVTTFERIWEYATGRYFGNVAVTSSGPPRYYRSNEKDPYKGKGEAIPDILYVANDGTKKCLAIFDAKYYTPHWENGVIWGAPANSDIAKQIQYYHSLKRRYPDSAIRFCNAFLLPEKIDDKLYRYWGYAIESDEQNDEIVKTLACPTAKPDVSDLVLLYGVDPMRLWKACLQGKCLSQENLFEDFIDNFAAVQKNNRA